MLKNSTALIICLFVNFSNNAQSCTPITQVPVSIANSGDYCLTADLINHDPLSSAIIINSDNVSVDLQNHKLAASDISESHSSGIEANEHSNLIIKNGTIKHFMYGVRAQDTDLEKLKDDIPEALYNMAMHNIQVFNISFEFNTFRGVYIQARDVKVSHSRFYTTGGTTIFPDAFAMAIEVSGNSCSIKNNMVKDVYPVGTGEAVGISVSSYGDGCKIQGNNITNHFRSGLGRVFGIWIGPIKKPVIITGNTISGVTYAGNVDRPEVILLSANNFNKSACADFYDRERAYYIKKEGCLEEDINLNLMRAEKGDANFLYKLGLQYHEGLWVNKSREKSYFYFNQAANKGHVEALRLRDKYGKPVLAKKPLA